MTILFGHPTGNPNSHHAALAHFEAGRLEAFCVPWMPSTSTLAALQCISPLRPKAARLARRHFGPLALAPKIQGRTGEVMRIIRRELGQSHEQLAYEANDWLMRTMRGACARRAVTAVHAYEDCSLWEFEEAKRLGKACIYDMPIGYYPAWEHIERSLEKKYAEWMPSAGLPSRRYARPSQKRREMELADLVLVPSSFAARTIRMFHPEKLLVLAAYGVDLDFWSGPRRQERTGPLRFIYAGQISLRKGIPLLLAAWEAIGLKDAELELVGSWQLAEARRTMLPSGVTCFSSCSREALRQRYLDADVFIFPSFFEGFGLVLLEAMACGLPIIATDATAGPDLLTPLCGHIVPAGDLDAIVENLRWFDSHREQLPELSRRAREQAEKYTWHAYRRAVADAVAHYT